MTSAEMAIENVESVLRGEITEPSVGTLAWRVVEFARNYGRAVVTVTVNGMELWAGGGYGYGQWHGTCAAVSTISVADFDEGGCAELPVPAFDYIGTAVAAARRGPGELSETEKTAIAIAFGVPYKMIRADDGRTVITTGRCGIAWTGDKISVVTMKNDRGSREPWLLRRELGVSDV